MIGNDLVDLDLAKIQSNWRRKGYLEKIFTNCEQDIIKTSTCADETVWTFWSMKEAAYKIHNRKTGIRNFAPKSLACSLNTKNNDINGLVTIDDQIYFTKTTVAPGYVHTIAAPLYSKLNEIEVKIYIHPNDRFDYKSTEPGCVSHHGQYLALVYERNFRG